MSVVFKGFSGLQTPYQTDLLIGQDTWCVSLFIRLSQSTTTDSDLMNSTYIIKAEPRTSPSYYPTDPNRIFWILFGKSFDPSLVNFVAGIWGEASRAEVISGDVDAFATHHILFGRSGQATTDAPTQPLLFIDGVSAGNTQGYLYGSTIGISDANSSDDQNFAIRLGNIDLNQAWPGTMQSPYPDGSVSYSIKNVAVWHGWFPESVDIIALRDQTSTPDHIGTGLQCWWTLSKTTGNIIATDTDLQNAANPGTYDLGVV